MKIIRPVQVTQAGSFTRNSTGTYFDSNGVMQTAVANAIRITYDPSNLSKAPYALIERAATNLQPCSEQFDNATWWPVSGVTVTANSATAPNALATADKMVESANQESHFMYTGRTATNETVTFSVFVKAAGRSVVYVGVNVFDYTGKCGAFFDLISGTVRAVDAASTDFTAPSASIAAYPNGWFRCSFTVTKGSVNATYYPNVSLAIPVFSTNVLSYQGDGVSGVYVWGAQLEAGSVATSYITTTTAPVTRAADAVGTNGLLYSNIPETDYPAWSATTAYSSGDKVLDAPNHKIYQAIGGLKNAVTIPASSTVLTMVDINNTAIVPANGTPVKLGSTATLPSGFNATTTYYVVGATTTAFSLSASVGGAAISSGTAGSGTYTLYAQTNLNKPLNDILNWVLVGNDNRWSMFDQSITSQTSATGKIQIVFAPGTRLDSVVGLNCLGSTAQISMVDAVSGAVVYSTNVNLTSNSGINNLYAYLYEPIVQIPDFVLDDLPVGVSGNSLITLTMTGSPNAAVGGLVFGLSKDIGLTEWGTKVSTTSFSVKTQDTFGNYTITPRAFSKRADFTIQVPTDSVDYLENLLTGFKDFPIVYIGYNSGGRTKFNSTVIYGFYKDFEINIAYNAFSVCSLTVEGLT